MLVDAQGSDPVESAGIIDERSAVTTDRSPRPVPSHPEGSGHRSHALPFLAHQSADLPGRPAGQAALDELALLGEGLGRTVGIGAEPPALPPHQSHRPSPDGEIPDLDLTPPVTDGPNRAGRTAHHLGRRLDEQPQFVIGFGRRKHDEPVHSQQRARATTTVIHAPCPPFSLVWYPQESGATGPYWWMPMSGSPGERRPTAEREEPD